MRNDEAIKYLENMKWLKGYDNTMIGDEQLIDIINGIIAMLKEYEDSCWISVKDKLPVRNTNVLWWCVLRDRYMGHVRIGFYDGTTNHDIPDVSCCGPNCIPLYWMPMPNAPTEVTIDALGNWYCHDGKRSDA